MTAVAPSVTQIRAQLAAIRKKDDDGRVIGIRTGGQWTGEPVCTDGATTFRVVTCTSPLAVREALHMDLGEDEYLVVLTPLDERELGDDIRLRLARQRLHTINAWDIVKALFHARTVDARLTKENWLADYLLENIPDGGYAPVAGGFLDAEVLWPRLMARTLGLSAARPDLVEVLVWSAKTENVARSVGLPKELKAAFVKWLRMQGGQTLALVLETALALGTADLLPVVLAAEVVFSPEAPAELAKASGHMEANFFQGASLNATLLRRAVEAAHDVVRQHRLGDDRLTGRVQSRMDEILEELLVREWAHLSPFSPVGATQRLDAFGRTIEDCLRSPSTKSLDLAQDAYAQATKHWQVASGPDRRRERMEMVMRLLRWYVGADEAPTPPASLGEAISTHRSTGSYLDWARLSLRGSSDAAPDLARACGALFEAVRERCERESQTFASLLQGWLAADSPPEGFVPVEDVLTGVVAPLASELPVLVVVMDGMSGAVANELVADLTHRQWVSIVPEESPDELTALATVPSVTSVSRASLLSGKRTKGSGPEEKKAFANHSDLLAACGQAKAPNLFHKADLDATGAGGVSDTVRQVVADSGHRVVGVVINTIDDFLLKGEQLEARWTVDTIRPLGTLLEDAHTAGRAVVLISDHGHVLDAGSKVVADGEGERWRDGSVTPVEGEIRVEGPRVVTPNHAAVVPWSETLRYGMKKNGYHGGVSPQEMVIPVTILFSGDEPPAGWKESALLLPVWWEEAFATPEAETVVTPAPKPKKSKKKKPVTGTKPLFAAEEDEDRPAEPVAQAVAGDVAWVEALLASPVLAEQRSLAGRIPLRDEVLTKMLCLLAARGGKLTTTALARALRTPPVRLPGMLAVAQRLLNLDGYAILQRDAASDTVELDVPLLKTQFALE